MRISTILPMLFFFLLQLLIIQPAISASSVVEITGGVPVEVPAPPGFVEGLRSIGETMTAPTNRLLALFLLEPELKRMVSGKSHRMTRYCMAQTSRKLESTNVSAQDFVKLRKTLKLQQRDLIENSKNDGQMLLDTMSEKLGRQSHDPSFTIKLGEMLPLGVFHETDTSIGISAYTKVSSVVDGKTVEIPMVSAWTTVLVKGKVVYFYVYSEYKSKADIEWTRSVSRQWVSSILSLNKNLDQQNVTDQLTSKKPKPATEPANSSTESFNNVLKKAESGDAVAQYSIGSMYFKGEGVPQDNKKAVEWIAKAAEQGLAVAQYTLGSIYSKGEGVAQDKKKGIEWYTKSAEQGFAAAQFNLGNNYYKGEGVIQDKKKAVEWLTKAAEKGFAESQHNLGSMYFDGEGVTQDKKKAVELYTKAAEQGFAASQYNLGFMYNKGEGVIQDKKKAVEWLTKAAEQGDAAAQYSLGFMYNNGEGVTQDNKKAVKWYTKAAEQGIKEAQNNLNILCQKNPWACK